MTVAGPIRIGVDAGSSTWKAVAIGPDRRIVATTVERSEPKVEAQTERVLRAMLGALGGIRPDAIGATGYGRKRVPGAVIRPTEIAAHAFGAAWLVPEASLVLDVGGQDAKAIRLGPGGRVLEFAMNDRCAAGTGRFLENTLARLDVAWDQVETRSKEAARAARVSSTCAVFAETEIVGMIAEGTPVPEVVRGLIDSLAERLAALVAQVHPGGVVVATGGVARCRPLLAAVSARIGFPVRSAPEPQIVGALGAALLAGP